MVLGFMYEGMKEKEEGAREPPGFLVTEEGELVPGTRLAMLQEGKVSGEGHKLGPGNVGGEVSPRRQAHRN